MSTDLSERAHDEGLAFKLALEHFYQPPDMTLFAEALEQLHRTADAIMVEHRHRPDGADLLARLMSDATDGDELSEDDLRRELMTLLMAGHETTANALCWTWILLAQHPREEAALAEELERRLSRGTYFSFGDGPRVCVGRPLAILEMVLVIATIAQRFQLVLTARVGTHWHHPGWNSDDC